MTPELSAGLIRAALPEGQVLHAPGVNIDGGDLSGLAAALELCAQADAVILCLGEAATMSGEAASRAHPHLPGRQRQFAETVFERARVLRRWYELMLTHQEDLAQLMTAEQGKPLAESRGEIGYWPHSSQSVLRHIRCGT